MTKSTAAIDAPIGPPKKKKAAPPEIPRNKVTEWVTLEDGTRMRASSQRLEDAEAWVAKVRDAGQNDPEVFKW